MEKIEILADRKATPSADFIQNEADITKAQRLLDYDPQISAKEGVHRFWDWYFYGAEPCKSREA